jgi:hypothetical protein
MRFGVTACAAALEPDDLTLGLLTLTLPRGGFTRVLFEIRMATTRIRIGRGTGAILPYACVLSNDHWACVRATARKRT